MWSESVSVGLRVNLFALSAISNFHCIEFECLKLLYRVECAYGDSKELIGSYIFPIFKPFVLKIIPSFWIAAHNSFKTIANGRFTSKWLFRVVFFSLPQAVVGKRGKSNFPKCNTPVCNTCIWCPMARKSHCFCKGSAFLQEYAENHKVRQLIAYWFLLCRYLCGVEYLHCDLHERTIDENAIGECTWVFL